MNSGTMSAIKNAESWPLSFVIKRIVVYTQVKGILCWWKDGFPWFFRTTCWYLVFLLNKFSYQQGTNIIPFLLAVIAYCSWSRWFMSNRTRNMFGWIELHERYLSVSFRNSSRTRKMCHSEGSNGWIAMLAIPSLQRSRHLYRWHLSVSQRLEHKGILCVTLMRDYVKIRDIMLQLNGLRLKAHEFLVRTYKPTFITV